MLWKTKDEAPYGWRSYRRNLIVLYEALPKPDEKINALIEETKYGKPGERPGPARQWADLNEVELRIFHHLDDAQLVAEMERKFAQAKHSKLPGLSRLKAQFQAVDGIGSRAEAERRALAFVFLEEMFVKYSYRFSDQEKRKEVSRRLTYFGLLLLAPLFIGLVLGLFSEVSSTPSVNVLSSEDQVSSGWVEATRSLLRGVVLELAKVPWRASTAPFGTFFIVAYSGIVGAYFSRLFSYVSKMQDLRVNEMDVLYSPGALFVRLLVGAIGALIVFFLMMGNLLSGEPFPKWDQFAIWVQADKNGNQVEVVPLQPTVDFAKLVVWSFIAGFFERFVPDRLEVTKKRAQSSGSSDGNQQGE